MNSFSRGRGFAISSGILFILYCIISNIDFFKYISMYATYVVVMGILFFIIPMIVFGILLIVSKMNYGLIISPIMLIVYYGYNLILIITEITKLRISNNALIV